MQSSIQRMVSDGTLQFIDLAINYIDKVNVQVYVDDVPIGAPGSGTPYTYEWITDTRIKITPVVPLAGIIVLRRLTPTSKMYHVYDDGATFNDFTMDENFKQLLFIGQEAIDGGVATDYYSDINMHLYRIKNIGDAVDPRDAVPLSQYQADALGSYNNRVASAASASAALASQNAAASSANRLLAIIVRADYTSDSAFKAAKVGKVGIDASSRFSAPHLVAGDKSFGSAGDVWPSTVGLRDAITVSRDLQGLTDCHGFADKTVIDGVTDYGGYGVFDATTIVRGSHAHNHIYSYQDRVDYQGSGTLDSQAGLLSRPKHSGSGTITSRYGVDVGDVSITAGGALTTQIGVFIRNLSAATTNVGLNIAQASGYALYASGGAPSYHKGQFAIGVLPEPGAALTVSGDGVDAARLAMQTTATFGYMGMVQNVPLYFLQAAGYRLEIGTAVEQHAVRPGADNTQPLGDASKRWKSTHVTTMYLTPVAVANLPAPTAGAKAFVNNATATTFGSVVAGGGSNAVPVYGDGANWRIG